MYVERAAAVPLWKNDELGSPIPPHVQPAYFDEALNAWVLSRHSDVLRAMRSSSLVLDERLSAEEADQAFRKMREETLAALSPAQLRSWFDAMAPSIQRTLQELPAGQAVDLVGDYLQPLCLELAAKATEIDLADAVRLSKLAFHVSASAAEPSDALLREQRRAVSPELRSYFHSETETLRDSGFVALSQTFPSLLANCCFALVQSPSQWALLHQQPQLIEQGIEELFRHAGLSRYLRRWAAQDVEIAGAAVKKGDLLILRIIAANHDAERFACPHQLDVLRKETGHLTFGSGPHACSGASLLRAAATKILRPLIRRFSSAEIAEEITWRGGSGFRAPQAMPIIFRCSEPSESA